MSWPGIQHGDRALYLGIGQRRGKQCDVLGARRITCVVRWDDGEGALVPTGSLTVVPRRAKPMF